MLTPENIRVHGPKEGIESTGVTTTVANVRHIGCREIQVLQSLKDNILREIGLVRQSLFRRQESQALRSQIRGWEAGAVVSVLQHHANTAGGLGQLVEDALLEEYQAPRRIRLSRLQHDHGAAGLVVGGVEPVSQVVLAIAVRLVAGIVVEVVNWHREVIRWV